MFKFLLDGGVTNEGSTIYGKFTDFLYGIAKSLDETTMLFIALGLIVLITLVIVIARNNTYEKKLMKSIKSTNKFLNKNPYVTEENLVELNAKMKASPKTLRHSWQEYMLNREKLPSEYMNTETVIDHPCKASGYKTSIRICKNLYIISAILMALLLFSRVLANFSTEELSQLQTNQLIIKSLFDVMLIPGLLLFVGFIIIAIFESSYASFTNDLFYEYREFQGYINKACTTMPPYIDYEILFTQKEIKEGISVLQEYLDKKAIQEQKEKEEKELDAKNYEKFDFDELGVEGSILLERAMTECEKYFNIKRNLVERRTSKEQEIANYSKNFDEVTKDFERKSQTIRESMNQITEQLNNTSVKIEANYLKKRYDEEQQKLQQLEKDHQLSEARFKKQQAELQEELNAIDEEVESRKKKLETIMLSEGKSYSNKIYGLINDIVNKQNEPHIKEMEEQKNVMQSEIDNMRQKIASYEVDINAKSDKVQELEKELGQKLTQIETIDSVKEYFGSDEFRRRVSTSGAKEFEGYDDLDRLRAKLLHAEEQLMLLNENKNNLEMQTKSLAKEYDSLKKQESDFKKLKEEEDKRLKEEEIKRQQAQSKKQEGDLENIDFDQVSKDMIKSATEQAKEKKEEVKAEEQKKEVEKQEVKKEALSKTDKMNSLNQKKASLMSSLEKLKKNTKK